MFGAGTGEVTGATHYNQFQEVLGLGERLQEGQSDETHVFFFRCVSTSIIHKFTQKLTDSLTHWQFGYFGQLGYFGHFWHIVHFGNFGHYGHFWHIGNFKHIGNLWSVWSVWSLDRNFENMKKIETLNLTHLCTNFVLVLLRKSVVNSFIVITDNHLHPCILVYGLCKTSSKSSCIHLSRPSCSSCSCLVHLFKQSKLNPFFAQFELGSAQPQLVPPFFKRKNRITFPIFLCGKIVFWNF